MERYRTSGVLDENALNELKKHFINNKMRWVMRFLAAAYALFGLFMLSREKIIPTVLCVGFAVLFVLFPGITARRFAKVNAARLKEAYPGGARSMESYFDQDGLVVINRSGGENVHILYAAFSRAAETEHYFFLVSKAGQFSLVYKNFLTADERAGFIPFLQEKCPKIKVVR